MSLIDVASHVTTTTVPQDNPPPPSPGKVLWCPFEISAFCPTLPNLWQPSVCFQSL